MKLKCSKTKSVFIFTLNLKKTPTSAIKTVFSNFLKSLPLKMGLKLLMYKALRHSSLVTVKHKYCIFNYTFS